MTTRDGRGSGDTRPRGARVRIERAAPEDAEPVDAKAIVAPLIQDAKGGWLEALSRTTQAVNEGRTPATIGALTAVRSVVAGVIHENKRLPGPMALPLPPGARLLPPGPPIDLDAPIEFMEGRDADGLVPVPWWAATQLVSFLFEIEVAWQEGRLDATLVAHLLGVQGEGRGERGYFQRLATDIERQKMALKVAELRERPDSERPTLEVAREIIARQFGVSESVVAEAWRDYRQAAQAQLAAIRSRQG